MKTGSEDEYPGFPALGVVSQPLNWLLQLIIKAGGLGLQSVGSSYVVWMMLASKPVAWCKGLSGLPIVCILSLKFF